MINIEGTRDFSEYKTDFFKGLDFRETIFGVATLIIAGGSYFLLVQANSPSLVAVYIAIILGLPVGIMGFFKKNEMNFLQFLKRRREIALSKPLLYQTGEVDYLLDDTSLVAKKQSTKKSRRSKDGSKEESIKDRKFQ